MTTLNDWHIQNAARQQEAFAPPHPIEALVVCVGEEVGELCAAMLGVTGEKARKKHLTNDDVLDACADAFTYGSLVASAAGIDNLESLLLDAHLNELAATDEPPMRRVLYLQHWTGNLAEAVIDGQDPGTAVRQLLFTLVRIARSRECTDFYKLIGDTFNMVSDRVGSKIRTQLGQQPIAEAG
jgi:hypothetical protein